MVRINRREFVKLSGSAAAISLFQSALQKVLAQSVNSGTLGSIAHVVIFSQENRSFDNYFGMLKGVRGFSDPHALTIQKANRTVMTQANSKGSLLTPWYLNSTTTAAQCLYDLGHSASALGGVWNNGRLDSWRTVNGDASMGYFDRTGLPWQYALADAFTLCDQYFCPLRNATDPNRLYLMSGMIDPNGKYGGPVLSNSVDYPSSAQKIWWTTYPERLQAAGISWCVYHEANCYTGCGPEPANDYGDNALAWFDQYKTASTTSPLYINGVKGRNLAQFINDVAYDTLPAVSWVLAPDIYTEHPGQWSSSETVPQGSPAAGAYWVSSYLQALASNPQVWNKTLFILTYDENGGFFDHIAPPVPPSGTPDEFVNGASIGLGFRVPTIICSPWSRGGFVASEVFDHTSILQFLEKWTGVAEPNISQWRRDICGDLTSCFDFTTSNYAFPILPDSQSRMNQILPACNLSWPKPPTSSTTIPSQETGQKSLRVQPYQLECWLTSDLPTEGGMVWINWVTTGTKSIALQVNENTYRTDGPWFYKANPKVQDRDYWHCGNISSGYYDLELHGPNGFYRRFKGYLKSTAWNGQQEPDIQLSTNIIAGQITISFKNIYSTNAASFVVLQRNGDNTSTRQWTVNVPAGQTLSQNFPIQDGWYDYRVTLTGDTNFRQEMAGHIEGTPGLTQPPLYR